MAPLANGTNGDELEAKGPGFSGRVKGTLAILIVVILGIGLGLGFIIWKKSDETTAAIRENQRAGVVADTATERRMADQHEAMTRALERVSCSLYYTQEERRSIRLTIEKNPQLKGFWCP